MDYFEYLKNKENISFYEALEVLVPLFVKVHKWNVGDDVNKVRDAKYKLLKSLFEQIVDKKYVEGEIFRDYVYDDFGNIINNACAEGMDYPEKVTYLGESTMKSSKLYSYIEGYLQHFGYEVPYEIKLLIGDNVLQGQSVVMDTKYDPKTDKLVCQGIARALWDIYPNMTLKEMTNQRAIQIYGNGSQYKDPKTLPGWLSEVDPRPEDQRRGPKKKSLNDSEVV